MLSQVATTVRALYNEGVPFFTKESLRDLVRQIDETNAKYRLGHSLSDGSHSFRLPTLQEDVVEVKVETGSPYFQSETCLKYIQMCHLKKIL